MIQFQGKEGPDRRTDKSYFTEPFQLSSGPKKVVSHTELKKVVPLTLTFTEGVGRKKFQNLTGITYLLYIRWIIWVNSK